MHILHLSGSFGHGGAEMGIVRLTKGLAIGNIKHSVCSVATDLRLGSALPPGVRLYTLGIQGFDPFAFLALAKLIKHKNIDLVHVNNLAPWHDAALSAFLTHIRCVLTFHGIEQKFVSVSPGKRAIWKIAEKMTCSVTAVDFSAAGLFYRMTGISPEKIRIIPNGVDTKVFKPCDSKEEKNLLREKIELPAQAILLGSVAALRPVKDHYALIKNFSEAIKSGGRQDIYLVLVGDGPLRKELERLSRRCGLQERVIFLGQRSDIPQILKALDVFVLNSVTEGMSYAVLEAMAAGLPIVATRVGANAELVRNGIEGFLCDHGDDEAMIQTILRLTEEKERFAEMGIAARERVMEHYSFDKMVSAYESLYTEVMQAS